MSSFKNPAGRHSAVQRPVLDSLNDQEALEFLGDFIDESDEARDAEALYCALDLCEQLLRREMVPADRATLHYFYANAWEAWRLSTRSGESLNEWEQKEIEIQLLHLRTALRTGPEGELPTIRLCQILTNLGNLLSHVGRSVEALEYWERALQLMPDFGMARGNLGYGLVRYARLVHDRHDSAILLCHAHQNLEQALRLGLHDDARQVFEETRSEIKKVLPQEFLDKQLDLNAFALGDSAVEVEYRKWALQNRLFLNPLNDIGPVAHGATDVLHLPGIVVPLDAGPYYAGFFNQMKQEFVSARYLLYEGLRASPGPHFSDRGVSLVNTLDYPSYSLAAEKTKAAFRIAYSLFDKIAFFVNHYLDLGVRERSISFKTIWYTKQDRERGLAPKVHLPYNEPLQGLFWLSKDLSEKRPGFAEAIEPDAQEIEDIRQHAEHRYLKLHEFGPPPQLRPGDESLMGLRDTLARSLGRREFESKVLRIFKMARAGLVYLTFAVHVEEYHRSKERGSDRKVAPMLLDTWKDEWKF